MNEIPTEKAPLSVRLLGWFLILGGLAFVAKIVMLGSDFGLGRGIWNVSLKALAVASGIGLLMLRRWAVYLYVAGFVVGTAVFYIFPPSEEALTLYVQPIPLALLLVVPTIIAVIVWKHWQRLR